MERGVKIVGCNRILGIRKNNILFNDALLVFCLCGIIGILLDVDHVIAFMLGNRGDYMRIAHKAAGIISCIVLCITVSLIYRYIHKPILKDSRNRKIYK
jgi:hypothetical protein